jgi:hypothetical protein
VEDKVDASPGAAALSCGTEKVLLALEGPGGLKTDAEDKVDPSAGAAALSGGTEKVPLALEVLTDSRPSPCRRLGQVQAQVEAQVQSQARTRGHLLTLKKCRRHSTLLTDSSTSQYTIHLLRQSQKQRTWRTRRTRRTRKTRVQALQQCLASLRK